MLRRLRARAVDGATMLARALDARRERNRLRDQVTALEEHMDERHFELLGLLDERNRLTAEVERLTAECDDADRLREESSRRMNALVDAANARSVDLLRRVASDMQAICDMVWRECPHGMTTSDAMNAVRQLIADRDLLRALVERLTAERDEHAQGVSVLACRIDRVQQERDAAMTECGRLREALDLNQRSREASNAGHEALRRELSALLTGDDVPLEPVDIVERVRAAIAERDARIPTDIDGAQAWAEERGALFMFTPDPQAWRVRSRCMQGSFTTRWYAVAETVAATLRATWQDCGGDA